MTTRANPTARRRRSLTAVFIGAAIVGGSVIAIAQSTPAERVIKISAERYEYSPDTVVLQRGEPVILELTARDRMHGFHISGLGARADVLPGHTVRVRVVPMKDGKYPFTCDLFCGSGHTDMGGMITVVG